MQPQNTDEDASQLAALVTDSIPEMLAYWDSGLICRFANAASANWFGKTPEEMVGIAVPELLPAPMYELHKPYIAGALAGNTQHFEQASAAPGGGILYLQVSFYPDKDNNEIRGIAVHAADITRQKLQKQQAEESKMLIGNQNKTLLNFANIVSHNLKSYANNLEVMLCMYESEPDKEERERIFDFLKEISAGFKSSVENLKEIVQVQNLGKVPTKQVNLHKYAMYAADMLHAQMEATKATIYNNIHPEIHIEANPAYVESIVLNFIDNAIKYRHPDCPPEIELSAMEIGAETVLNIKDNGGIDLDNNRHKLYGMYNTFHGNKNATGLGLFMAKQQVDNMGGYIGVESNVGTGTWFRIYFKTKAIAV